MSGWTSVSDYGRYRPLRKVRRAHAPQQKRKEATKESERECERMREGADKQSGLKMSREGLVWVMREGMGVGVDERLYSSAGVVSVP